MKQTLQAIIFVPPLKVLGRRWAHISSGLLSGVPEGKTPGVPFLPGRSGLMWDEALAAQTKSFGGRTWSIGHTRSQAVTSPQQAAALVIFRLAKETDSVPEHTSP